MTKALLALIAVLLVAGAACIVCGVYLLAGAGWAAVAAGMGLIALAVVLERGLING